MIQDHKWGHLIGHNGQNPHGKLKIGIFGLFCDGRRLPKGFESTLDFIVSLVRWFHVFPSWFRIRSWGIWWGAMDRNHSEKFKNGSVWIALCGPSASKMVCVETGIHCELSWIPCVQNMNQDLKLGHLVGLNGQQPHRTLKIWVFQIVFDGPSVSKGTSSGVSSPFTSQTELVVVWHCTCVCMNQPSFWHVQGWHFRLRRKEAWISETVRKSFMPPQSTCPKATPNTLQNSKLLFWTFFHLPSILFLVVVHVSLFGEPNRFPCIHNMINEHKSGHWLGRNWCKAHSRVNNCTFWNLHQRCGFQISVFNHFHHVNALMRGWCGQLACIWDHPKKHGRGACTHSMCLGPQSEKPHNQLFISWIDKAWPALALMPIHRLSPPECLGCSSESLSHHWEVGLHVISLAPSHKAWHFLHDLLCIGPVWLICAFLILWTHCMWHVLAFNGFFCFCTVCKGCICALFCSHHNCSWPSHIVPHLCFQSFGPGTVLHSHIGVRMCLIQLTKAVSKLICQIGHDRTLWLGHRRPNRGFRAQHSKIGTYMT